MTIVTVPKADTALSDLVARAEAGEEIILARGDTPVVKLVPVEKQKRVVEGYGRFAHLRDQLSSVDILAPVMSEEELDAWENKPLLPDIKDR
ncbi:type II toxin-antitoxin system Phd/YefM family antitoxin [Rhizobium panacihumi]|uniref:type II toxin-antitoxin system Phd/YefM family antitoxin n=1 Tax=Rhizobium panacihumi TaxID=2008450 RepID=UPI003D7B56F1